jgi:hypothetical protein
MSPHMKRVVDRLLDAGEDLKCEVEGRQRQWHFRARWRYFAIDRHKLAYLNGIEKVSCTFCSYANGLIAYVREVAARTEQYWCPIQHARVVPAPHQRYQVFLDYGDAHGYRKDLPALRHALRARANHGAGRRRKAVGHVHRGR